VLALFAAVLRIRDAYLGSEFSIPDPRSKRFRIRIHNKDVKYFNPKNCFIALGNMIRDVQFIPDTDLDFLPILDPGVKKAPDPDPQHWFADGSQILVQLNKA
jgi:hypothetical protein